MMNKELKSIKFILKDTEDSRKTLGWKMEYGGERYGSYCKLSEDEKEINTNENFVDAVNLLLGQAVDCIQTIEPRYEKLALFIMQVAIDEIRNHRREMGLDPCWDPSEKWMKEECAYLIEQLKRIM